MTDDEFSSEIVYSEYDWVEDFEWKELRTNFEVYKSIEETLLSSFNHLRCFNKCPELFVKDRFTKLSEILKEVTLNFCAYASVQEFKIVKYFIPKEEGITIIRFSQNEFTVLLVIENVIH